MHSATMAALAKQGLIETVRDADGVVLYKTFMERRVIVDDGMPVDGDVFTSFLFGQGAIGFQDIGAPVGVETDRDSLASSDILINRRHFVLHPRGIKWALHRTTEAFQQKVTGNAYTIQSRFVLWRLNTRSNNEKTGYPAFIVFTFRWLREGSPKPYLEILTWDFHHLTKHGNDK